MGYFKYRFENKEGHYYTKKVLFYNLSIIQLIYSTMKKKYLIVATFVISFFCSVGVVYATHYILGYSSVDSGEIRWGGHTTYSTPWNKAIATWNALGKINITPDTIYTYEDLRVKGVDRSWVTWTGRYIYSIGTDTIQLNRYYLDSDRSGEQQNTATHELGHSLGLDDHEIYGNIMYYAQTSQTALGSQDIDDYGYLWGY